MVGGRCNRFIHPFISREIFLQRTFCRLFWGGRRYLVERWHPMMVLSFTNVHTKKRCYCTILMFPFSSVCFWPFFTTIINFICNDHRNFDFLSKDTTLQTKPDKKETSSNPLIFPECNHSLQTVKIQKKYSKAFSTLQKKSKNEK